MTVIVTFVKTFSLEKAFTYSFQYFRKSARKSESKGLFFERLRVSFKHCSLRLSYLEFLDVGRKLEP